MAKEILTYDDLLQIVQLIKSAEAFSEFHLKVGDIELDLRKADAARAPDHARSPDVNVARTNPQDPAVRDTAPLPSSSQHETAALLAANPPSQIPAASRAPVEIADGMVVIESPMVGTFYRRPEPGARPFIEVGDRVEPDTTVCIIEVMKLMNSIPAGCAGIVTHVLVGDAEAVEAGQKLIVIDPRH